MIEGLLVQLTLATVACCQWQDLCLAEAIFDSHLHSMCSPHLIIPHAHV